MRGLIRFNAGDELETVGGYRRVVPDWEPFAVDMLEPTGVEYDRPRLEKAARRYFIQQNMQIDADAIDKLDDISLVTALSMLCPFATLEKQALLEAKDLKTRAEILVAVTEIELAKKNTDGETKLQ